MLLCAMYGLPRILHMYEYTTAFITGIKSFDNYEEYLNTLKKNKIDEAVQIYQNAYDRYLAKHSS